MSAEETINTSVDQAQESVNYVNTKILGEQSAYLINQANANNVTHQARLNSIAERELQLNGDLSRAVVGMITKSLIEVDPSEAIATKKMIDVGAGDLSQGIAQLNAAIASIQQLMKGAQTTPPQTGQGG